MAVSRIGLKALGFHFGHRIHGRVIGDTQVAGIVGRAVDQQFVHLGGRTAHREARGAGVIERARETRIGIGHDAERQLGQGQRGAARDRHVLDLGRSDHLSGGGAGGLQDGRFARDADGVGGHANLHTDIDA